jgi:hypothetical protein
MEHFLLLQSAAVNEHRESSVLTPEVMQLIHDAARGIPKEVWEAIGLAQKMIPSQSVEYRFSNVGACDAFESRHQQ